MARPTIHKDLQRRFDTYPARAQKLATRLHALIYKTAAKHGIDEVAQSLKWGEPAFKSPKGSAFRMDWKEKTPDQFYLFFHCQTTLVESFRLRFGKQLSYEGNRAVVLNLKAKLPVEILEECFAMALNYHAAKKSG